MALTARQQQVLRIIIDEYVHQPVPVASENVTQRLPVRVSPATVRSEIAALEEEGYIVRPHTSAGGVPSDKAYRAYVEFLGEDLEPPRRIKQLIRRGFTRRGVDVQERGRAAVRLLAELVHAMAISTVPVTRIPRWKHLDIVHIHGLLALLILVLQGSTRLRQQFLHLNEPLGQDHLTYISNKLNFHFGGLAGNEIRVVEPDLAETERQIARQAQDMLNQSEEGVVPEHFVDGLRHMFSYPELSEGAKARALAELLERQQLVRVLTENIPERGLVRVTIGEENKEDRLRPFTVVFARYGMLADSNGIIGVVGPTRFEYASAIANVKYLASVMSETAEVS